MSEPGRQLTLPILADLTPRGDGTFVLRPRMHGTVDQWVSPKDAAVILGFTGPEGRSSVYRLIAEGMLTARRPSPRKILVSLASVHAHRDATADPEFWARRSDSSGSSR